MTFKVYWGGILRELRTKHNLTQEDVANLLHVSRSVYSNIELGNIRPTAEMIAILTEVYDTELYRYVINSLPADIVAEQTRFKANLGHNDTGSKPKSYSNMKGSSGTYYGKANEDILEHLDEKNKKA